METNTKLSAQIETILSKIKKSQGVEPRPLAGQRNFYSRRSSEKTPTMVSQSSLLNKKSIRLAQKQGSSKDRILAPKHCEKAVFRPHSHRPEINQKSKKIAENLRASDKTWENLYDLQHTLREKNEVRVQEALRTNKELKECTFKPKVYSQRPEKEQSLAIETRLINWQTDQFNKIEDIRTKVADKDLEECTFTPSINEYKTGNSVYEDIVHCQRGVLKFLERQECARRLKQVDLQQSKSATSFRDLSPQQFATARQALHSKIQGLDS